MLPKLLFVDDEAHVLSGYKRNLRSHFDVHTAESGKLGLEIIKKNGPFHVIVSDFKMPEMNGNQFLAQVKNISPDSVRILLTGYADLSNTIEAVNEGNIFRLLTKPCSIEKLINSLNDANRQYQLVISERELLDKTLKGSIKVLVEILSNVNPIAFNRVSRFQKYIPNMGKLLNVNDHWELEISTLLSQIGLVTMPSDLLLKKSNGEELSKEQEELYYSHPVIGHSLLKNIPRLDKISEAIKYQFNSFNPSNNEENRKIFGENLPVISRILRVLNDFDNLIFKGFSESEAFDELRKNEYEYDPNVLIALDATIAGVYQNLSLFTIQIEDLESGVIAASDIKDKNGQVLITKGSEITEFLIHKLINFSSLGHVDKHIKILKYV